VNITLNMDIHDPVLLIPIALDIKNKDKTNKIENISVEALAPNSVSPNKKRPLAIEAVSNGPFSNNTSPCRVGVNILPLSRSSRADSTYKTPSEDNKEPLQEPYTITAPTDKNIRLVRKLYFTSRILVQRIYQYRMPGSRHFVRSTYKSS